MNIIFHLITEEAEGNSEKTNLTNDYNLYCTNELLKILNINGNDVVVISNQKKEEVDNGKFLRRRVCCCVKNCKDLIGIKKKLGCYHVHVNQWVLKSLDILIEEQKKEYAAEVNIVKAETFAPIGEIKMLVVQVYNESFSFLKDCNVSEFEENKNKESTKIWNELKSKNLDRYISLSLLNVCLFQYNYITLSLLGMRISLLVNSISCKTERKVAMKKGGDDAQIQERVIVPFVNQNTKVVFTLIDEFNENIIEKREDLEEENRKSKIEKKNRKDIDSSNTNKKKEMIEYREVKKLKGFAKMGGYSKVKEEIYYHLLLPLIYKDVYDSLQIEINRGVLLHGLPGCGKTFLALCIKEELQLLKKKIQKQKIIPEIDDQGMKWSKVNIPEMEILKSTDLTDATHSGQKINELFLRCYKRYTEEGKCSLIFIDEIEILCEKRDDGNINIYTTTLLNNMDGIQKNTHTIIIGATNFINSIDLALRRSGRFEKDIEIGLPNLTDRIKILKRKLGWKTCKEEELKYKERTIQLKDIKKIADQCQAFTCSDINALVNIALYMQLKKKHLKKQKQNKLMEPLMEDKIQIHIKYITLKHLKKALQFVKPSGMKELYIDVPKTRLKDIGGYTHVKRCIKECLIFPKKYKRLYQLHNITSPKGILLYGPPGCSKTLFAKAIASEIRMNFISVKGPEIFSKYVGESEKTIRNIFKKARENSPCVIFFDEMDSIAMNRNTSSNVVSNRVLCQLLNEMDGIYNMLDVLILGATNRPDLMDPALMRPGRFDRIIYVPLPNYKSRIAIWRKTLRHYKINYSHEEREEIQNIEKEGNTRSNQKELQELCCILAKKTKGYSGAEIVNICREASIAALRQTLKKIKEKKQQRDDMNHITNNDTNKENKEVIKKIINSYQYDECVGLSKEHFLQVLKKIKPQTPKELMHFYETFNKLEE